jgi:hypothetical protein
VATIVTKFRRLFFGKSGIFKSIFLSIFSLEGEERLSTISIEIDRQDIAEKRIVTLEFYAYVSFEGLLLLFLVI